jgi:hypothetical protein
MIQLARYPALRDRMGSLGDELVSARTHDRYASDFEQFVEAVLARPRRRG